MALKAPPFLQDYTPKELEQFQRALKGAAIGKGRKLTPQEIDKCRGKVRARIAGQRRADIQLARLHKEMLDAPSFEWRQPGYRRDK